MSVLLAFQVLLASGVLALVIAWALVPLNVFRFGSGRVLQSAVVKDLQSRLDPDRVAALDRAVADSWRKLEAKAYSREVGSPAPTARDWAMLASSVVTDITPERLRAEADIRIDEALARYTSRTDGEQVAWTIQRARARLRRLQFGLTLGAVRPLFLPALGFALRFVGEVTTSGTVVGLLCAVLMGGAIAGLRGGPVDMSGYLAYGATWGTVLGLVLGVLLLGRRYYANWRRAVTDAESGVSSVLASIILLTVGAWALTAMTLLIIVPWMRATTAETPAPAPSTGSEYPVWFTAVVIGSVWLAIVLWMYRIVRDDGERWWSRLYAGFVLVFLLAGGAAFGSDHSSGLLARAFELLAKVLILGLMMLPLVVVAVVFAPWIWDRVKWRRQRRALSDAGVVIVWTIAAIMVMGPIGAFVNFMVAWLAVGPERLTAGDGTGSILAVAPGGFAGYGAAGMAGWLHLRRNRAFRSAQSTVDTHVAASKGDVRTPEPKDE